MTLQLAGYPYICRLIGRVTDADYVAGFQALASVEQQMHQNGPQATLLLAKAEAELNLGEFDRSIRTCIDARIADQRSPEIRRLSAEAHLLMGLHVLGYVTLHASNRIPNGPALMHIHASLRHFQALQRLSSPSGRQEADEVAALLTDLHQAPSLDENESLESETIL